MIGSPLTRDSHSSDRAPSPCRRCISYQRCKTHAHHPQIERTRSHARVAGETVSPYSALRMPHRAGTALPDATHATSLLGGIRFATREPNTTRLHFQEINMTTQHSDML